MVLFSMIFLSKRRLNLQKASTVIGRNVPLLDIAEHSREKWFFIG